MIGGKCIVPMTIAYPRCWDGGVGDNCIHCGVPTEIDDVDGAVIHSTTRMMVCDA